MHKVSIYIPNPVNNILFSTIIDPLSMQAHHPKFINNCCLMSPQCRQILNLLIHDLQINVKAGDEIVITDTSQSDRLKVGSIPLNVLIL